MTSMLRVEDIHTYYGHSYILQGLTLNVEAGETVAVLGRNAAGKTTLVRSIVGFTPVARGRIVFRDLTISGLASDRIMRSGLALVPQGRRIFRSLTVEETLTIAARSSPLSKKSPAWLVERVYAAFPRLHERRTQRSETLSGGEQQMLVTGRALVSNPDLILLDEPTEGLSPRVIKDLQSVLRTLRTEGVALLIVEQRVNFALALADRIYLLDKGRVALETSSDTLRADPELRQRFLGV
jgi:branched-chain amino acid transport system ATP-binding protein